MSGRIRLSSGDYLSYSTESNFNYRITPNYIINYIKNNIIKLQYRISILNPDETIKSIIPSEDIIDGSYNENYQNGQRRTLSVNLYNENGNYTPNINNYWINDKFLYEVGVETQDNIFWFKKGVYVINNTNTNQDISSKKTSIELGDKFLLFDGPSGVLETTYVIPVGTNIKSAIADILYSQLGNGYKYDYKPMFFHSSLNDKTTQITITKEAGSSIGEIISELCTQLNAEYFYDVDGCFNVLPINDVIGDFEKPIVGALYAEDGDFVSDGFQIDFGSVINRVCVIGGSVNGRVFSATAINDNVNSPVCYQRVGYKTAQIISDSNITSDILAQDRANYELRNKTIIKTNVSLQTYFNPYFYVNNIFEINDDFFKLKQSKFVIQSVSHSFNEGLMVITASNIENLPFLI